MGRLPRAQLQRMQALMQKAMAGKDVSREAKELEATLPPGFLETMKKLQPQAPAAAESALSEDEARRLVEEAAAEGKISREEATAVLGGAPAPATAPKEGGWKRWFGSGKKP